MKFNKSLFSSLLFVVAFSFFGNAVSENELNPEGRIIPKRLGLPGYKEYLLELMQEFVYSIEDYGLQNLPMKDFNYEVKKHYFGVEAVGNVSFTEGFIDTIQAFDIFQNSLNWDVNIEKENINLTCKLQLTDVNIFYNYRARLTTGNIFGTVGTTVPKVAYKILIIKNFKPEVKYSVEISSDYYGSESEWEFYPFPKEIELLRRDIRPSYPGTGNHSFWKDLTNIGKTTFKDLLIQSILKVNEKLPFPELCLDCSIRDG